MKKSFRTISLALIILTILSLCSGVFAFSPPSDPVSPCVLVINTDTDRIIYEKNADKQVPSGVLAQVMTEILVMEKITDPENTNVTAKSQVFDLFNGNATYTADIQRNETLTAHQMMMGMFIQNSYEAAASLAYHVGGDSISSFVKMMNEKSAELGTKNTNFTNPYGGDDQKQTTSAKDMALIAKYAMTKVDGFMTYSGKRAFSLPTINGRTRNLNAVNLLLLNGTSYYNSRVTGMKTGTTSMSGRCLIATASKGGFNYMIVILGAPVNQPNGTPYPANQALQDANALFKWVFEDFSMLTVAEKGSVAANVEVKLSMGASNLILTPKENFVTLVPSQANTTAVQKKIDIPKYVKAPISKGDTIGVMKFYLEGEELGSVDLVATEDISMNQFLFVMDLVDIVFGSIWFKLILGALLVAAAIYLFVVIRINRDNKKKRKVIRDKNSKWKK